MKFDELRVGDILHFDTHYLAIFNKTKNVVQVVDCNIKDYKAHQCSHSIRSKDQWDNPMTTLSTKFIKAKKNIEKTKQVLIKTIFIKFFW